MLGSMPLILLGRQRKFHLHEFQARQGYPDPVKINKTEKTEAEAMLSQ